MNQDELKPCPFCGAEGRIYGGDGWDDDEMSYWCVECSNNDCGCDWAGANSKQEAIEKWNTRVGDAQ